MSAFKLLWNWLLVSYFVLVLVESFPVQKNSRSLCRADSGTGLDVVPWRPGRDSHRRWQGKTRDHQFHRAGNGSFMNDDMLIWSKVNPLKKWIITCIFIHCVVKILRISINHLKTIIYRPKIRSCLIVGRYRAIPFTVSENGTDKPVDLVNNIDIYANLAILATR